MIHALVDLEKSGRSVTTPSFRNLLACPDEFQRSGRWFRKKMETLPLSTEIRIVKT